MDYKLYKMNNYNLYFMKTDKFKTISLSLRFRKKKSREDAVYISILKDVLNKGTKKYKKINDFYKARLNIYDPNVNLSIVNFGSDQAFVINAKFANEKYTEKGMNEKTIEFIFDMLYNPYIENEEFNKEIFEICKHDYIEVLKSAKDNPFQYAADRLWEEMDIYDFKILTNEDAIEIASKMTSADLYRYYKTLFTENSLDIFVLGDFDYSNMKKVISKFVKGNFKDSEKNHYIKHSKVRDKLKEVSEDIRATQSQLALGLKFTDLTDFERKYVSIFYISILGGNWSSKLMQVIREKYSLCYFIGAVRSISHGVGFIYASIDAKNYDKVLELIQKQIKLMIDGDFSLKHIDQVKQIYTNSLLEIDDNQTLLMNNLIDMILSDNDSIEERRKNINKVSKEDIINFAKKVNYDAIFFLKGDLNYEN